MRTTSLRLLLFALTGCNDAGLPATTGAGPPGAPTTGGDQTQSLKTCDQVPIAFTIDHDIRLATGDGGVRTVYTFASQLPSPVTSFIGRLDDVRGGRVVADGFTYYAPEGQPAQFAGELVVLDTQGNVVWHKTGPGFGTPYLGADGTLAVWDGQQTLLVAADGSQRTLAGKWSPVAPATDGSLLVQAPPPAGDGMLGWLRPGSETVELLDPQPEGYEEWVGDRLAYVAKQNGQEVLVLATPDASSVVTMPGGNGAGLSLAGVAGGWLLVQRIEATTPSTDTLFRLDVKSGAVEQLQDQAPPGMRHFDVGGYAQLTDDGSLLSSFRNDFIGEVYRSTDLGVSWAPIGFTVANVQGLSVIAAASGTLAAQSQNQLYAANSPWKAPPAGTTPDVTGPFVELVRPDDGVRFQLPALAGFTQPIAIGDGGHCAAYWTSGADTKTGRLEVFDVSQGQRKTLVDNVDVSGVQHPLWLIR
jgi:hypothetical protein